MNLEGDSGPEEVRQLINETGAQMRVQTVKVLGGKHRREIGRAHR